MPRSRLPSLVLVVGAAALVVAPWLCGGGLWRSLVGDGRLEDRLRAQLPLRPAALRTWNTLRFRLAGTPPPTVVQGADGWWYYRSESAGDGHSLDDWEGAAPAAEAELAAAAAAIRARMAALAQRGATYLAVLTPDKHLVHPEHLPASLRRAATPRRAEALTQRLTPGGVLDLAPVLAAAATDGRTLYPRTDSHWHDGGAYLAYVALHHRLVGSGLRVGPVLPRDAFAVGTMPWAGDIARLVRAGLPDEMVEAWSPLADLPARRWDGRPLAPARRPLQSDIWSAWREGPDGVREAVLTVDDPSLPTAVVFHDSFMPALLPYLAQHFRRVRCVWHHWHQAVVDAERPDVVLQLIVARNAVYFGRGE